MNPKLRKPKQLAWLKAVSMPLQSLVNEILLVYNQLVATLSTNARTELLQARLRVLFPDTLLGKMWVKTVYDDHPSYYTQDLGEHHIQEYDYDLGEAANDFEYYREERDWGYDFYIIAPTDYTTQEAQIINAVNVYRPAGKRIRVIFQNIP